MKAPTMAALAVAAAVLGAALLVVSPLAQAQRRGVAIAEFKQAHPCPATGRTVGRCAGHVIGHIVPACAGGTDSAANMQWLKVAEARDDAGWTQEYCRFHRARTRTEGAML